MSPMPASAHQALTLATVIDTEDPDSQGRVKVRLASTAAELWAAVASNSAGADYGVHCLPRVDETVVVAFLQAGSPVVLGAIWTGAGGAQTEQTPTEDRYSLVTPHGHKIIISDRSPASVLLETAAGQKVEISEEGGGEVTIEVAGSSITVDSSSVSISASGDVSVQAAQVQVSAAQVQVDAAISSFSGMVRCDVLQTNTVIATTYTPGAGNIW